MELTWDHIDLRRREITVVGKGGKRRSVPINDNLMAVLESWSRDREGRLFPDYTPNQVSMRFLRRAREVGLPEGVTIHSLRATFTGHLIDIGVDIYTVSRLLGHSSVKVTERYYLAPNPDQARTAVELLNFARGDTERTEEDGDEVMAAVAMADAEGLD